MGAQQSSGRDNNNTSSAQLKTCYYELLGVEHQASDEEQATLVVLVLITPISNHMFFPRIKKAYRKRALELHPDRNINDVENATKRFAEIQAAYEVLSDPQERAWYDSHREAILGGHDPDENPGEFFSVGLTTTEDIFSLIRRFDATIPLTDEPTGFFSIARETFERLAAEEAAAADFDDRQTVSYPTFGRSNDDYELVVKPFYAGWSAFHTRKTYAWKDKFRLPDAPDRRVRRLMEKENQKLRDDAIRDFSDAVQFLLVFVRKRDPRYLPNTQTEAERQKSMRDAAAAQAARSRAANQKKLADAFVADWAKTQGDGNDHWAEEDQSSDSHSGAESEVEQIECVVCNKTFKSYKQFEAHERSKKHVKAVQQLRREILREDRAFNRNKEGAETPASQQTSDPPSTPDTADGAEPSSVTEHNEESTAAEADDKAKVEITEDTGDSPDTAEDGDYAPRSKVEQRLLSRKNHGRESSPERAASGSDAEIYRGVAAANLEDQQQQLKKVGKAKAKREKKAARQAATGAEEYKCSVCKETFLSRTKLFSHIKDLGHAAPILKPPPGAKKTKR
jgi:DnaJ homolog subfamily A member 5